MQKKYTIKPFKEKNGKQRKLKHEEIDISLYKPAARCVAFTTSEDRILYWLKTFQDRYYETLDNNNQYHVNWIDHYNEDNTIFEQVEVKVSRQHDENQSLLFTLSVYLNTGVIMCQGIGYEIWSEKEFTFMKEYIEKIYFASQETSENNQKSQSEKVNQQERIKHCHFR